MRDADKMYVSLQVRSKTILATPGQIPPKYRIKSTLKTIGGGRMGHEAALPITSSRYWPGKGWVMSV